MISKHSNEQSERGEGVEVVLNEPFEDPEHGAGQLTEKRIYLNKWVVFFFWPEHCLWFDYRNKFYDVNMMPSSSRLQFYYISLTSISL